MPVPGTGEFRRFGTSMVDLLFTEQELEEAAKRAANNPEDYMDLDPSKGEIADFFADLLGL
jgi:hypothetical protein